MRWVRQQIGFFLQVLHSPETAFVNELSGPSYLVPLCILGLLGIGISVLQSPIQMEWIRFQLEAAGTPAGQIRTSLDMMNKSVAVTFLLTPALLFLRWLLLALMIWLTAAVFLDALTYKKALTIVAYSYLPILARDAVTCVMLLMRSDAALRHADGMTVALGLDLLFPSMPLPWSALAGSINLFEIWFVTLLVVGISKTARTTTRRALGIVLPTWIIAVVLQSALATLGHLMNAQMHEQAAMTVR
jgi:Yip1 domain